MVIQLKNGTYNIGKRLHNLRNLMGMTQAEVAAGTRTDTEKPMDAGIISKYEGGGTIPGWRAIERILAALGQTPCALFPDECRAEYADDNGGTFTVDYFTSVPNSGKDMAPIKALTFKSDSEMTRMLHIVPESGRYNIVHATTDLMIPHWYPGDFLFVDHSLEPKVDNVIVGFHRDTELRVGRLIRYQKALYISPSNRHYPMKRFERKHWSRGGTVVYVLRSLIGRAGVFTGISPVDGDDGS